MVHSCGLRPDQVTTEDPRHHSGWDIVLSVPPCLQYQQSAIPPYNFKLLPFSLFRLISFPYIMSCPRINTSFPILEFLISLADKGGKIQLLNQPRFLSSNRSIKEISLSQPFTPVSVTGNQVTRTRVGLRLDRSQTAHPRSRQLTLEPPEVLCEEHTFISTRFRCTLTANTGCNVWARVCPHPS